MDLLPRKETTTHKHTKGSEALEDAQTPGSKPRLKPLLGLAVSNSAALHQSVPSRLPSVPEESEFENDTFLNLHIQGLQNLAREPSIQLEALFPETDGTSGDLQRGEHKIMLNHTLETLRSGFSLRRCW